MIESAETVTKTSGEQSPRHLIVDHAKAKGFCFTCLTRKGIETPAENGICKACYKMSSKSPIMARPKTTERNQKALLEWNGKKMNIEQWSKRIGIGVKTITSRLGKGWSVKKALSTPLNTQYRNKKAGKTCK